MWIWMAYGRCEKFSNFLTFRLKGEKMKRQYIRHDYKKLHDIDTDRCRYCEDMDRVNDLDYTDHRLFCPNCDDDLMNSLHDKDLEPPVYWYDVKNNSW